MFCQNCGENLIENTKFCYRCGAQTGKEFQGEKRDYVNIQPGFSQTNTTSPHVGFSNRINDPAFARYTKNANRWSGIFSVALAIIAVVGFFIAGEMEVEGMENPQALYIGLVIGGMFMIIALFQIIGRKKSKTWDGQVVDKQIKQKRRKKNTTEDDFYWEDYTLYVVYIRGNDGKKYEISVENDDTVYRYYKIGDYVRHHAGINTYEKYDKTGDSIIFCSACATLCDISNDICPRCKCPLLK